MRRHETYLRIAPSLFTFSSFAVAQQQREEIRPRYEEAIEDNSLLMEEVYNQEPGVLLSLFHLDIHSKHRRCLPIN